MSELTRRAQTALVSSETSTSREVGKVALGASAGTLAVTVLASLIPFVGTFGLAVVLGLLGLWLYLR